MQREIKRFWKRVCGGDATQDTHEHLMSFFNMTSKRSVELSDFCSRFVKEEDFLTGVESDMVLMIMLEAFDDHRCKKPPDRARTEKLSKILRHIHEKVNAKHACAIFHHHLLVVCCAFLGVYLRALTVL